MSTAERDPLDPGWVCEEPDCNGRAFPSKQSLRMHQRGKHPERYAAETAVDAATRQTKRAPARGPKITRAQKLEGSLAVVIFGLGMASPAMGAIWTPYVPNIAGALDACANEYKWARQLVDAIENAGPISMLLYALGPPLLQTMVHFRLLPPATARVVGQAAGMGPPPAPAEPTINPDGSVDLFGVHYSAEQVAQAAAAASGIFATGGAPSAFSQTTEVPVADGGTAA